jgi:L-threonylcarbamoyladenylate synthase
MDWQIAVCQTDTVWALVAKLDDPENQSRIYKIKGRPEEKPLILFAKDLQTIQKYSEAWNDKIRDIANRCWPGALTIILPRSKKLPAWVNPDWQEIGFRIPNSKSVMKLLDQSQEALLLSTSANLSGEEPVSNYSEAKTLFSNSVDLILKPEDNEILSSEPSAVIKVEANEIKVLRNSKLLESFSLKTCFN